MENDYSVKYTPRIRKFYEKNIKKKKNFNMKEKKIAWFYQPGYYKSFEIILNKSNFFEENNKELINKNIFFGNHVNTTNNQSKMLICQTVNKSCCNQLTKEEFCNLYLKFLNFQKELNIIIKK